ncbi:MAG: DJ-1/PfpI family protein [Gemmatimonadetes bacterium]|nr:DJ-1/PfpI family protein [Gemmatimonadota bacterium]
MQRLVDALSDDAAGKARIHPATPRQIAMVIYPGMFPLDLVGPHSVLSGLMNTRVHIVAKSKAPVAAGGLTFVPTATFDEVGGPLDVLFVPGGGEGTVAMMRDPALLGFLRRHGATAKYVTSVCTGSLVLGAAGLLTGYRATTHWVTHPVLAKLGATPVNARVVEDRNRITAAGVSAGIDFGLTLAARMTTEKYAKALQLNIEYDPAPPYQAGSPKGAGERITAVMREMYAPIVRAAEAAAG